MKKKESILVADVKFNSNAQTLHGKVYSTPREDELEYVVYATVIEEDDIEADREIGSGKLLLVDGTKEIDCFTGNVSRDKVIVPLVKKLAKLGYTSSF